MKIKVFADTICGWCFIGHTRLLKATKKFKNVKFEIEHFPFQLNPGMSKDGINRDEYLISKFGGKENAQSMYDHMTGEAIKEGLEFNLDKIKKTPNTVSSHILINLGKKYNTQTKILENLYQSYFIKSLDIGNENILANIGKENGINENQIRSAFNLRENIDQVNSYSQIARQKGINGVPFFEIGKNFISGAQSVTNLEKAIQSNF